MTQMYKVVSGAVVMAEVSKTTEESVWETTLTGTEVRKTRAPKSDTQPAFFDTLEEAKTHLLTSAKLGVEEAARRFEAAKVRYQQIVDLQAV